MRGTNSDVKEMTNAWEDKWWDLTGVIVVDISNIPELVTAGKTSHPSKDGFLFDIITCILLSYMNPPEACLTHIGVM